MSDDRNLNALGSLTVYIRGAHNLLAADSNGLSDPYVICHVPSCEAQKTHVIRKSLNPVWGSSLEFRGLKLGDVIARGIRLEVFDHDTFSHDDKLGEIKEVDLSALQGVDCWHYNLNLPTQGTLEFTVTWLEQNERLIANGTLTLTLLSGKGLMAADANGFSDPYVKLTLGKVHKKSKTVPKTLNPMWDEPFEFKGLLAELADQSLHLECFDHDTFSKDDKLGDAHIQLSALKLVDDKTYNAQLSKQGSLRVHLHWAGDGVASERISAQDYNSSQIVEHSTLRMKVGSITATWKDRYFELTESELSYFPNADELKPLGVLPLDCLRSVSCHKSDPRRFSLRVADGPPANAAANSKDANEESSRSITRSATRALGARKEKLHTIELAAADFATRERWVKALTTLCGDQLQVDNPSARTSAADPSDRSSTASGGGGSKPPPSLAKFYGVSLSRADLMEDGASGLRVPSVLLALWEELQKRGDDGLGSEGIFRLSAGADEVNSIKKALDTQSGAREAVGNASVQALAALIKLYLRELPDDVWAGVREQIDALPLADCVSGWGEGDGKPEELHGIIQSIVYQLDPSGADLVVWVCDVMVAVVAKEESNRMNVGAASTVFAPGLVHAPISAEAHPVALMMASEKGVQLTTYLLRAHMFKKLLAVRPASKMEDEGAATVVDVSDAGGGGGGSTPKRPARRPSMSEEDQMAGLQAMLEEAQIE